MRFGASWVRRTVSVLLATFVLLVAPQVAHAAFTASPSTQMSVGTASVSAPYNVSASGRCNGNGITVTVSDFDVDGPTGLTYRYQLYRGTATSPSVNQTSTSTSQSLTGARQGTGRVTWRVQIRAEIGNWSGDYWSGSASCG